MCSGTHYKVRLRKMASTLLSIYGKNKNAYLAEVMFYGLFVLTYDPRGAGASVMWRLERGRRIFSNKEPHETKRSVRAGSLET